LTEPSEPPDGTVVLTARRDAGAGLQLLTLTPPPALARAYRAPGQFIKVHADSVGAESPGYFVFAGEVGAPSWELLVRNSGGAADLLSTAPEGTTLPISGPLGTGYPLDRAQGKNLVVAVVGSALAVARPILRERIARRECARTHLYIGARSGADVPLAGEVVGWARAGARLVLCLSRPDTDDPRVLPGIPRRRGWVQQVVAEDLRDGLFANALLFAAGPQGMLEETRALARGGGRPAAGSASPPVTADGSSDLVELEVITNV
jgi:NAD(P)H-flavin reductase